MKTNISTIMQLCPYETVRNEERELTEIRLNEMTGMLLEILNGTHDCER